MKPEFDEKEKKLLAKMEKLEGSKWSNYIAMIIAIVLFASLVIVNIFANKHELVFLQFVVTLCFIGFLVYDGEKRQLYRIIKKLLESSKKRNRRK